MAMWTNDPATSQTRVRAVHINELRRVVSFYRQQAGLPNINWTDGTITSAVHVRSVHFTELRSAIQDLWNYHGMGSLPNWSVGSAPSSGRQVSARDINDLRSWVNQSDPPLNLWTGFHWCSPLNNLPNSADGSPQSSNEVSELLLNKSGRWGTVILCPGSNNLDGGFQDAIDKASSTIAALGDPKLDQCVVRIYNPSMPTFTDYQSALAWIQPYVLNLNYFVSKGGQNIVLFNELNVAGEPQQNINPITLALIAAAFRDSYTNTDGSRQLYILFPGPGGDALSNATSWNGYWDTYDLRNTTTHSNPQTFDAYYGSGVDARLHGYTMLYHGGTGIFDRVALHCYATDPSSFSLNDPTANQALQVIQWYLNPPSGSGAAVVDTTGWCYATECGGQSSTPGPDFGDSATAGVALVSFEVFANERYTSGNSYGNPGLLQAIYGYILDYSNSGATVNGQYEIGHWDGTSWGSTFLDNYVQAKSFP